MAQANVVVFLTSGVTWTVPTNYGSLVSVEAIGGGAGGRRASGLTNPGPGGGGGAYAKITSATLTAGSSITVQVGTGGAATASGTASYFGFGSGTGSGGSGLTLTITGVTGGFYVGSTISGTGITAGTKITAINGTTYTVDTSLTAVSGTVTGYLVNAAPGTVGTVTNAAGNHGVGGLVSASVGSTIFAGGNGGDSVVTSNFQDGAGGGGAAGPNGAGWTGGTNLNGSDSGGGGGGAGGGSGSNGGNGTASLGGAGGNGPLGTGGNTPATGTGVAGTTGTGGGGSGAFSTTNGLGGAGATYNYWTATAGGTAGPGGGGGGSSNGAGGSGGLYGGGGGGAFGATASQAGGGIIVVTYLTSTMDQITTTGTYLVATGFDEVSFNGTTTFATRLTNTGTFYLKGQLDEVTYSPYSGAIVNYRINSDFALASFVPTNLLLGTSVPGTVPQPEGTGTSVSSLSYSGVTTAVQRYAILSVGYPNQQITYSVYLRANTIRYMFVVIDDGTTNGFYGTFDLVAGTFVTGTNGAGINTFTGMRNAGNGWYRCSIGGTVSATATRISLAPADTGAALWYPTSTGPNGTYAYVWGHQIELGTTIPTVYQARDAAGLIQIPYFAKRIDSFGNVYVANQFDEVTGIV